MSKDGRETQWRQITEHEKPEMVALPDGLDDKYVLFSTVRSFLACRLCNEKFNKIKIMNHQYQVYGGSA